MNVLVDTSVWIAHFRHPNQALTDLSECDRALTHPMVIAEIACGTPPDRLQTLANLELLRSCTLASLPEVMAFVEREKLYDMGCGLVDLALLASTLLTPNARLWTLDKRLVRLSERFGVRYGATLH